MESYSSSLQNEKYKCYLNRLNTNELIEEEHKKQVELGLAQSSFDFILQVEAENQMELISENIKKKNITKLNIMSCHQNEVLLEQLFEKYLDKGYDKKNS